jgi:hypothetical protein
MDSVLRAFRKIPRKLLFKLAKNEEWTAAKRRPRVYGEKIESRSSMPRSAYWPHWSGQSAAWSDWAD